MLALQITKHHVFVPSGRSLGSGRASMRRKQGLIVAKINRGGRAQRRVSAIIQSTQDTELPVQIPSPPFTPIRDPHFPRIHSVLSDKTCCTAVRRLQRAKTAPSFLIDPSIADSHTQLHNGQHSPRHDPAHKLFHSAADYSPQAESVHLSNTANVRLLDRDSAPRIPPADANNSCKSTSSSNRARERFSQSSPSTSGLTAPTVSVLSAR